MTHPTPTELLELHFEEARGAAGERIAAHARVCPDCGRLLGDLAWAEQLLAVAAEERPPANGLQRVMAAVEALPRRVRVRRALGAALPSAAAMVVGALALGLGGPAAAAVFFAAGCLVTLSLAPILILEGRNEGRTTHTAAR